MDNRKEWTSRQTELRRIISSAAHFEDAIQLFLQQHAATHTAKISGGQDLSVENEALAGLSDEQIRTCPRPGKNSIAWLLWHAARIEDITMNALVLEQPQILDSGDWAPRLGTSLRDVGSGMDKAGVTRFSAQVSVQALKDYRAAVGVSTQNGIPRLAAAQFKEIVPAARVQTLVEDGSISREALWLAEFYSNRPKSFFLTRTATSHNFQHISEAGRFATSFRKMAQNGSNA
jgi:hypothetical protein